MKIRKSSLHYKFNNFWAVNEGGMPKTLCNYFWYTMFNVFRTLIAISLTTIIGTFLLSPIGNLFIDNEQIASMSYAALCIYGFITSATVIGLFFTKASFGRVVLEYINTLKDKVCPLVEYEGKKDDSSISS